jgi:hypothetical protein
LDGGPGKLGCGTQMLLGSAGVALRTTRGSRALLVDGKPGVLAIALGGRAEMLIPEGVKRPLFIIELEECLEQDLGLDLEGLAIHLENSYSRCARGGR